MTEPMTNIHFNDISETLTSFPIKPSSLSRPAATKSPLSTSGKKGNSLLQCMVCADISSGKHYGVLACNGCSGFFKRSVRRKLIYRCQATKGACVVDKAHRNQCQACRLKKCLDVGMNKHAVQHERQPRNLATVKPSSSLPGNNVETDTESIKSFDDITPSTSLTGRHQSKTVFNGTQPGNVENHSKGMKILQSGNERTDWGEALKNLPFVVSPSSFCCTADDTNLYAYTTWQEPVYESSAKILFLAVRWARNLPAYANLAFRDQVILLEETWPKLFIISAIQWSMPLETSPLFTMDENLLAQTEDPKSISMAQKTLQSLQKTLARFKHLEVDLAEFACLKAIILFQGDTRGLKDATKVEALQDHAQLMLSQHVQSKPDETLRFGRLLLLLRNVYEVHSETLEYLFFCKINGSLAIEKMLCDMFKY